KNILAITNPEAADIKLAINKYFIGTPNVAYNANIVPATDAKPPVITANNSEFVILFKKGLITSGASVCPIKILASADVDSSFVVPNNFEIAPPKYLMINCIIP